MSAFKKFDEGKPELYRLFQFPILDEACHAMTYGAKKYGDGNWMEGNSDADIQRYYSAALRHLRAYGQGEVLDDESGIHHLGHAITNLLFISILQEKTND